MVSGHIPNQPGDRRNGQPRRFHGAPYPLTRKQIRKRHRSAQSTTSEARTPPLANLPFDVVLVTTHHGRAASHGEDDPQLQIAQLCLRPQTIPEICARLGVPLDVATTLTAHMVGKRMLARHDTTTDEDSPQERIHLLRRVLDALLEL